MTETWVKRILDCRRIDDALSHGVNLGRVSLALAILIVGYSSIVAWNALDWDMTRQTDWATLQNQVIQASFESLFPLLVFLIAIAVIYHVFFQAFARTAIEPQHKPFVKSLAETGHSAAAFQMATWAERDGADLWFSHWIHLAAKLGFREARALSQSVAR